LKPVGRKVLVTLRIDADVIEWFRQRGRGYQTRINSIRSGLPRGDARLHDLRPRTLTR